MEFNDISVFFGGTIFAEEYRGDFKQIEAEIKKIENADSSHNPLQDLAQRCLLRSIFEMLRGEYGSSQAYLDEVLQHEANLDDKWKVRLRLYERLNIVFRLTPPLIRFRSHMEGSASIIHECELEARAKLTTPVPSYHITSIVEMCESLVLQQLNPVYIATWVSASLHKQFAIEHLKEAAESQITLLENTPSAQILNLLANSELEAVHAYYTRLSCEINPENLNVEPEVTFANVRNLYLKTEDRVGIACYYILIGDRTICPPFTSPVALNLITDCHLLGWENEEWDKAESSFRLTRNEEADRYYSTALVQVNGIAAPRLRGAIALRRACIFHMTAVQSLSNGNLKEAEALFFDAGVNLSSAEEDFYLDESHLQIISCHKLLLDISRGEHFLVDDRALKIGSWGKSSGNTAFAQFLGILMMRFGRRLFLDHGRVDLAQVSLNCAKACFSALGDEVCFLHSNLAEAQLKHESGNLVAAQVTIDTIRRDTKALDYLRNLASRSKENEEALGRSVANLLIGYNRIVSNIYSSANNATAVQIWGEEYRRLKVVQEIVPKFLDPFHTKDVLSQIEAASLLTNIFNDYISQAYAALDQADVEAFDKCIESYLEVSTTTHSAKDIQLTHHIIAYTALCRYEMAREILPRAIESTFRNHVGILGLRDVRFEESSIRSVQKIDFNAA